MSNTRSMSAEQLTERIRQVKEDKRSYPLDYTESRRHCDNEIRMLELELKERHAKKCPHCNGSGYVDTPATNTRQITKEQAIEEYGLRKDHFDKKD